MTKAFISGCAGATLTASEIAFFREHDPWGLILFRRNCETPDQITKLVSSFRDAVSRADAPVLIDQEGGRVQRLRPPYWSKYPPQKLYGDLYQADPERGREAAALGARLIACDLRKLGITVDCLPLLDVAFEGMVDAIGDRSISSDPKVVADLGEQVCAGLLSGGVLPVLKHLPGHGRAVVDSHLEMPRVDATLEELQAVDFVPFKALNRFPLAMTAHILFPDVDPQAPATQSAAVIETLIRGKIRFSGCLMSDDISMKALGGDMRERCAATFGAGCDLVLHCNGELTEMEAVADVAPKLSGLADVRCAKALAELKPVDPEFDETAARARLQVLIGEGYA